MSKMGGVSSKVAKSANAKAIPELTDFLAKHPGFRRFVIDFHTSKTTAISKLDNFLEESLLNKDGDKSSQPKKRIEEGNKNPNRQ